MDRVRFGVIGLGLMGREFASLCARWQHLTDSIARPTIVSICAQNMSDQRESWFRSMAPDITQATTDYRALLANDAVDAVYVAVPHNLHGAMYCEAIRAGKHLFGEKPFGIDQAMNADILAVAAEHPEVFVRCTSQFPFAPAVQRIGRMIDCGDFGRIISVEAGFLHSSDLNAQKPANWKRRVETNGWYGCMGDLGMHVCHVPFRAGWIPTNVRAILSNIVPERPGPDGQMQPCRTWDNATLLCEVPASDHTGSFPMTLRMFRIAPGEMNTWYLTILGTKRSVRFSTRNINVLELLHYDGDEQNWQQVQVGHRTTFGSVTGPIFEFGFSDALLQMWAAYMSELTAGPPLSRFAGCVTPEETAISHGLFTAALQSHQTGHTVAVTTNHGGTS